MKPTAAQWQYFREKIKNYMQFCNIEINFKNFLPKDLVDGEKNQKIKYVQGLCC